MIHEQSLGLEQATNDAVLYNYYWKLSELQKKMWTLIYIIRLWGRYNGIKREIIIVYIIYLNISSAYLKKYISVTDLK